jgi:archaeal flagellar protein FlaI
MIERKYNIICDGMQYEASIVTKEGYTNQYMIEIPEPSTATAAILESVKEGILKESNISLAEIFDPNKIDYIKNVFRKLAESILDRKMPNINKKKKDVLISSLLHDMMGLGKIEVLLSDGDLEEIVINASSEPLWVYHKKYGWLKTNVMIKDEKQIQNYASVIARRIGRQITNLNPLLDAHLITGDRANATLFPVSTKGNTITIRKFARKPWTITDFISNKTVNMEVAAFLWLCMQYELNMIVAGGTSSGKTSLMNAVLPFIQPNHRIVSIEDTRELKLPDFLHWVPLTTREPNPEGKGEVTMLDLMINSLRMRPDRIIVGEIRKSDQAEVLFEAMHTGHSVYATMHADTADQVIKRLHNPPINIPEVMMEALHLIVVQFRDRRQGIRRTYQVAELLPTGESEEKVTIKPNLLYRCKANGEIVTHNECIRVFDILKLHTGMTEKDLINDLKERISILKWMTNRKVNEVNEVGKIIAEYYTDKNNILKFAEKNSDPKNLFRV